MNDAFYVYDKLTKKIVDIFPQTTVTPIIPAYERYFNKRYTLYYKRHIPK